MNASIAAGVGELSDAVKVVLITPADHPAIPAEVVAMLIQQWRNGALLAKPTWEGRGGHPVLVDLSFREVLLNLDPGGGLKAFFRTHEDQLKRVAVNSNYVARDMDTWDDYVDLHQDVFGVPPPPREIFERQRG
jgi:molybdenum cofactor cytidylyltransferase